MAGRIRAFRNAGRNAAGLSSIQCFVEASPELWKLALDITSGITDVFALSVDLRVEQA